MPPVFKKQSAANNFENIPSDENNGATQASNTSDSQQIILDLPTPPIASTSTEAKEDTQQPPSAENNARTLISPAPLLIFNDEQITQFLLTLYNGDQFSLMTCLFASKEVRQQLKELHRCVNQQSSRVLSSSSYSEVDCKTQRTRRNVPSQLKALSHSEESFFHELLIESILAEETDLLWLLTLIETEKAKLTKDSFLKITEKNILDSVMNFIIYVKNLIEHDICIQVKQQQRKIILEASRENHLIDQFLRKEREASESRGRVKEEKLRERDQLLADFNTQLNACFSVIVRETEGQVEALLQPVLEILKTLQFKRDLVYKSYRDDQNRFFTSHDPESLQDFLGFFKQDIYSRLQSKQTSLFRLTAHNVLSKNERNNAILWKKLSQDPFGNTVEEDIETKQLLLSLETQFHNLTIEQEAVKKDYSNVINIISEEQEKWQTKRKIERAKTQLTKLNERYLSLFQSSPSRSQPAASSSSFSEPQSMELSSSGEVSSQELDEMRRAYETHYRAFQQRCFEFKLPASQRLFCIRDAMGNTPLHYLIEKANQQNHPDLIEIVRKVLKGQPDLSQANSVDLIPLSYATHAQSSLRLLLKAEFENQVQVLNLTTQGMDALLEQGAGTSILFLLIKKLSDIIKQQDRHCQEKFVRLIGHLCERFSKELTQLSHQKGTTPFLSNILTMIEKNEKGNEEAKVQLRCLVLDEARQEEKARQQRRLDCQLLRLCCLSITGEYLLGKNTQQSENELAALIKEMGKTLVFKPTFTEHRFLYNASFGVRRFFTHFGESHSSPLYGIKVISDGLCDAGQRQLRGRYPVETALVEKQRELEAEKAAHQKEVKDIAEQKDNEIQESQEIARQESERAAQAKTETEQAKTETEQAKTETEQANEKAAQADERTRQESERAAQSDERARQESERRVQAQTETAEANEKVAKVKKKKSKKLDSLTEQVKAVLQQNNVLFQQNNVLFQQNEELRMKVIVMESAVDQLTQEGNERKEREGRRSPSPRDNTHSSSSDNARGSHADARFYRASPPSNGASSSSSGSAREGASSQSYSSSSPSPDRKRAP